MADYHPLITRAVEGLSNNTAEARRTLYQRARAALVSRLRSIDPPLSETEITRERLVLEDAIRKVEAESVRKARSEPRSAGKGERDSNEPRFAEPLRKEPSSTSKPDEVFSGDGSQPAHGLEQPYDFDDERRIESVRRPLKPADRYREPRPPRSYPGLAKPAFMLLIIIGLGALISWRLSDINGRGEPKLGGGAPQDQTRTQPPAAVLNLQGGPAVAQRVVLYEEDPANPQGKQYVGSATWRTETVSPGSGLAPELRIRANVSIPDRNMIITWSLQRNADQALPGSHTIEIMFSLPPDFTGGDVANIPGVLMKESEQARGAPLAGLAVKVTNDFFMIGLSAVDADVQRNMQLLKDRPWLDVPIVYNNGGRAILALEKGPSGDRAFADAFAAWGK
jgi:hypothetical protein